MNAHLAHASAARLMEHIELLPTGNTRQRARKLWVRSIENDWNEQQLAALLHQLVTRQQDASLSRANGRGSAGECPANYGAKTPAAGAWAHRDAATKMLWVDASSHASRQRPGQGVV